MKIAIQYVNKNPKCDYKVWIEGVSNPNTRVKIFSTDIKNQSYESMIDLDYYKPCVCKWEANKFYAYLESKKKNIKVLVEIVARAKQDVNVSWESELEVYQGMGSKIDYEQRYPKKVHFPSDVQIGAIDYKNLSSSDKKFDLEYVKEKLDNNETIIICNGYNKKKVISGTGYDWKLNISSLQK